MACFEPSEMIILTLCKEPARAHVSWNGRPGDAWNVSGVITIGNATVRKSNLSHHLAYHMDADRQTLGCTCVSHTLTYTVHVYQIILSALV